jgi:glucose/arabinose dehydrogenase
MLAYRLIYSSGEMQSILATQVATGLTQPLFAGAPPSDTSRLFIVEKTGAIKILDLASGQVLATPFLDLSNQIATDGERGLLGLAFDPDFANNGFFYIDVSNPNGNTDIRRYHVDSATPNVADPASATSILSIDQSTFNNHKGGWLGFGPDGDLYISVGDGGGGGDPLHSGQDINSLLGKILRIDVHGGDDFPGDATRNYHVPSDNPFVGEAGADEIFVFGLRNPWRPSFDRTLGDLYIADVGQNTWEEIDIGHKGANYGWNAFEGPAPFPGGGPLNNGPAVPPIYSYDHSVGHSITGGYVYRGEGELLQGQYFFADFVQGKVFTLRFDGSAWVATDRTAQIITDAGTIQNPSSFGEDARGNLYIVDFDGNVFKLTLHITINGLDYIASYGDLIKALGSNEQAGVTHFIDHGFDEGRTVTFNGLDYIASYGDLIRAFGANEQAGATHFIDNGFNEGRHVTFNGLEYIASYGDLIRAFGANEQAGATHYIDNGFNEGRHATFNGLDYIASYGDLIRAFGANEQAGATHYINHGFNEGRHVAFNGLEYIASYGDLIRAFGANEQAGATHYIEHGFNEGRTANLFDPEAYLAKYPDLQAAFGHDDHAATVHWITHGFYEGRDWHI